MTALVNYGTGSTAGNTLPGRPDMADNVRMVDAFAGTRCVGAILLPDGRVGIVFDNKRVIAVKAPTLVDEYQSERIFDAVTFLNAPARATLQTLDALAPTKAPTYEESRRARDLAAVTAPQRRVVARIGLDDADAPEFLEGYEAVNKSAGERDRRDATARRIAQETPEV